MSSDVELHFLYVYWPLGYLFVKHLCKSFCFWVGCPLIDLWESLHLYYRYESFAYIDLSVFCIIVVLSMIYLRKVSLPQCQFCRSFWFWLLNLYLQSTRNWLLYIYRNWGSRFLPAPMDIQLNKLLKRPFPHPPHPHCRVIFAKN